MADLTHQQVFDKVVKHLRAQGVAGACAYRLNGKKCAAGCLIDDEHYSIRLEGYGINWKPVQDALALSGVDVRSDARMLGLVTILQQTHDCVPPEYWEERFAQLAERYNLQVPSKE